MRGVSPELARLLETGVESLGFDLVDAEFVGSGHNAVLRVYIDSAGGITVDDCAEVSRQVSAMLDVEDPIAGSYSLEVSSPGLDRPLVRRQDFERFAGETVKVRMHTPIEGRKNFVGRLAGVSGDHIVVEVDNERHDLALEDIERARLVPRL